jgi:hypothetical protein
LRFATAAFWAFERFSVDHGRTSPAGIVVVHRSRSSCRERRPWLQVIDPAHDPGQQGTQDQRLGQLEGGAATIARRLATGSNVSYGSFQAVKLASEGIPRLTKKRPLAVHRPGRVTSVKVVEIRGRSEVVIGHAALGGICA